MIFDTNFQVCHFSIFLGGCYMEKLVHRVAVFWAMFFSSMSAPD